MSHMPALGVQQGPVAPIVRHFGAFKGFFDLLNCSCSPKIPGSPNPVSYSSHRFVENKSLELLNWPLDWMTVHPSLVQSAKMGS